MKIHFIGIGGIGMSALAGIHLAKGSTVTGSDLRPNNLTDRLKEKGAKIYDGHSRDNVPQDADLIVRSTCIAEDNLEMVEAKKLNIPVISRSQMLKDTLGEFSLSAAVTGTHGKTTTSALIAHIAEHCGKDPTVIVGGEVNHFDGNVKSGCGDMVVAEIDESDGHFRNIDTVYAVVTNIEREHMEHHGSLENLITAYKEFISRISPDGGFIFNGEDPTLQSLVSATKANTVSFGIDGEFDVTCTRHTYSKSIDFDLVVHGKNYGSVSSRLIGRYNLMNILGAIALSIQTGFDTSQVVEAIGLFDGVKRRFDLVGEVGDIKIIEDYAHHPTELRSVIGAAGDYSPARLIVIFQPHRYSRTRDMAHEFSNCFYDSDVLILTDVYSADEDISEKVGVEGMYEMIDKDRFERVDIINKKEDIPGFVSKAVKPGDTILVLGAGDIREISGDLIEKIRCKVEGSKLC